MGNETSTNPPLQSVRLLVWVRKSRRDEMPRERSFAENLRIDKIIIKGEDQEKFASRGGCRRRPHSKLQLVSFLQKDASPTSRVRNEIGLYHFTK